MNSIASDIRQLLSRRIESATPSEILDVAKALCANEDHVPTPVITNHPRFTKLDGDGHRISDSAADWVAVYDAETQLTWAKNLLGAKPWKDAMKAATEVRIHGKTDWRAPTLKEQLSIVDYARFNPVVDPEFFGSDTSWCWTSTVDAEDPSGYTWDVNLHNGNVFRLNQSGHYYVRAVRAGQNLSFGI